jgi:AcrR family transcriptional regulator
MATRRPQQQRSLATRGRLVAAALELFAARGFEGTTTRAIARRAGVALAALPYHFETKEALWRAAADHLFGLLRERFPARAGEDAAPDEGTRLRRLLRDFVRFAASHPELHRFMLREGPRRSPRLEWLVERHVRPLFQATRAAIVRAQADGLLPEGRPEHFYYAMIGAASMPYAVAAEYALLTGSDPGGERLVDSHVDAILRLFFPGSAAARPRRVRAV